MTWNKLDPPDALPDALTALPDALTASPDASTASPEENRVTCIICLENSRQVMLEPCNHVSLCITCAAQNGNRCPVCRTEILRVRRIFL